MKLGKNQFKWLKHNDLDKKEISELLCPQIQCLFDKEFIINNTNLVQNCSLMIG